MKNISYLLSLFLAFSYVSFADEVVKEVPKESDELSEDVADEMADEEGEEDKEPTISEFLEDGEFEVFEGWDNSAGVQDYSFLHANLKEYIHYINENVAPVSIISTGADREDTIFV